MSEECTNYLELMSLVIDGESTDAEDRSLCQHVLHCTQCRTELRQLWEMHQIFSDWEEQTAPEGLAQRVLDRIHADEAPSSTPSSAAPKRLQTKSKLLPFKTSTKVLASLAACAVVCVGLYRFSAPQSAPSDTSSIPYTASTTSHASSAASQIQKSLPSSKAHTHTQEEPGMPGKEDITIMVTDTLSQAPGTILVLEGIPDGINGTQYITQNGDTILVPETGDLSQLLTQLPSPLMEISGQDGPIVLLVLK